jgi:hypothetical protein
MLTQGELEVPQALLGCKSCPRYQDVNIKRSAKMADYLFIVGMAGISPDRFTGG